jgi:predicted transposase/invertase (TIGR01784 family)
LNAALDWLREANIKGLTVINPNIPVDLKGQKKTVFDIRARFDTGDLAVLEMQARKEMAFNRRAQFIISRTDASQSIAGDNYGGLKKCYLFAILDFVEDEHAPSFVTDYRTRKGDGRALTDDVTVIYIELPKLAAEVIHKPVKHMTKLERWAVFIKYVDDERRAGMIRQILELEEGILMAAEILREISGSEEERARYEDELIFRMDQASKWDYAKRQGLAEGERLGERRGEAKTKEKNALNLLKMGLDPFLVAEAIDLDMQTVEELISRANL